MAAVAVKRGATYEDLCAVPSTRVAEIVHGTLYSFPRPAVRHAAAASAIVGELTPPFQRKRGGPGGWVILFEPELHFGGDVLVPDIAGWKRERMPEMPDTASIALAPDWLCEILSPSTAALDRTDKMTLYAREGVRNLWLIEPIDRTLEIFRLEAERYVRLGAWRDDAVVRAEPFDAIELSLSVLWER
jgi:Uma2 family endonuclease